MSTVIYRRQSLDKSGEELGIDRQLKICKRVSRERKLTVGEIITDNSYSASKRGRPGYTRLIQMVEAGQVDTIVILRIDRLLRLNDELEELIKLVEGRGLRVITCEGDIDLSTPQGRLMARILVSVARSEMEVKGARHKLANQQKAEKGLPHGARRAFGYNSDGVTINEDEALVLKDIAHKFVNGWSYRELAYWLNAQGITTAQGKQFFPITIRNMLMRKRYAGIREYQGVEYEAVWSPVFDADTWARIQYTIKQRKERAGNQPMARKYLLTGFAFCGACGHPLNGEVKRDHPGRPLRPTYRCRPQGDATPKGGCGGVVRNAAALDHFIRELIVYRLDTPELAALTNNQDVNEMSRLLDIRDAKVNKLASLLDDYTDGTLTKPEYVRAKGRAQSALEAVQQEIKAKHHLDVVRDLRAGESVRERWMHESDGWRRQLISLLIEKITVNVGITKPFYDCDGVTMRFDPSLIDVDWRR